MSATHGAVLIPRSRSRVPRSNGKPAERALLRAHINAPSAHRARPIRRGSKVVRVCGRSRPKPRTLTADLARSPMPTCARRPVLRAAQPRRPSSSFEPRSPSPTLHEIRNKPRRRPAIGDLDRAARSKPCSMAIPSSRQDSTSAGSLPSRDHEADSRDGHLPPAAACQSASARLPRDGRSLGRRRRGVGRLSKHGPCFTF